MACRRPNDSRGKPWLLALLGAQQRIHHCPYEFQHSGEEGQAGCPPPEVSLYASGTERSNSPTQAHQQCKKSAVVRPDGLDGS